MSDEAAERVPVRTGRPDTKWSARQLLAYIRAYMETPDDRRPGAEAERARARAREERLEVELRAARETAAKGVAGRSVAGKPALSDFRKETWRQFADAINRLPDVRRRDGIAGVRLYAATDLLPDLYLLGLTPPRSKAEAMERDRLRRFLDSRPFMAIMARPEPWADRLRELFLAQAARTFFRPSVWITYEKSSDMPAEELSG